MGENQIKELLKENEIEFKPQYMFDDCLYKKKLKFDIAVLKAGKLQYLIEFDGPQHFVANNRGWNSEQSHEETHVKDMIKNKYCFDNNIPLIRIPYSKINRIKIEDLILKTTKFRVKESNIDNYYKYYAEYFKGKT